MKFLKGKVLTAFKKYGRCLRVIKCPLCAYAVMYCLYKTIDEIHIFNLDGSYHNCMKTNYGEYSQQTKEKEV